MTTNNNFSKSIQIVRKTPKTFKCNFPDHWRIGFIVIQWINYPGYHIPNAENCKTYFQCQANPAKKGGYEAILRDCPTGTAFDPSLGNCNHLSKLPRCVIGM